MESIDRIKIGKIIELLSYHQNFLPKPYRKYNVNFYY